MQRELKVFSQTGRFAVVQFLDRNNPGVVVQADTLSSLISELRRCLIEPESGSDCVEFVLDVLMDAEKSLQESVNEQV